jgi:iron complex transport system substrate-binding protein
MNNIIYKYAFIFLVLTACNQQVTINNNIDSDLEYADNYKIIKHKEYTEIQLLNPEKKFIERKYALVKKNQKINLSKEFCKIEIPLSSIICLVGTDIGMLAKLKEISKIKGISNINYVANSELIENFKNNKVIEYNDLNQISPEKVIGVSSFISYSGFNNKIQNENKFNQLGVVLFPVYDWREKHPLGKAEWIKLYGLLFGKENEAKTYFENIKNEYLHLQKNTKELKIKPTILSGSMIGDTWFMPAGNSFNATLIEHSGGNYVGNKFKGTGSTALSFEKVYQQFFNTEIWINPMFDSKSKMLLANNKYQYFKSFKESKMYCYSHQMNHFWENSAIEPHKILSDLIEIFKNPQKVKKKLYFYKQID